MSDMKVDENQKSYYPGIVSNRYVSCFSSAGQLLCSSVVEKTLSFIHPFEHSHWCEDLTHHTSCKMIQHVNNGN